MNLQVRTSPPPDWNRSGDWRGDWSMGQTFPVEELVGIPNSDTFTLASVKFDHGLGRRQPIPKVEPRRHWPRLIVVHEIKLEPVFVGQERNALLSTCHGHA